MAKENYKNATELEKSKQRRSASGENTQWQERQKNE